MDKKNVQKRKPKILLSKKRCLIYPDPNQFKMANHILMAYDKCVCYKNNNSCIRP